jgi:hypothetical protein
MRKTSCGDMIIMNQIINVILLLLLLLFPNTCGGGVKDKDDAVEWFKKNEDELNQLVDKLLAHPNIERVEDMRMDLIPKYGAFSDSDLKTYNEILKAINRLGVIAVIVSRRGNTPPDDLIGIEMLLKSKGLSIGGGYALSVGYMPDAEFVKKAIDDYGEKYYPLGSKDWYVIEITGD